VARNGVKASETVGNFRRGIHELAEVIAHRPDILGLAMRRGGSLADKVLQAVKSPNLGGRILSGALEGGGKGAVYGFLNGKGDVADRLKSALYEAASSSAVGAAVPFVYKGLHRSVDNVAEAMLHREEFWEKVVAPLVEVYVQDIFKPARDSQGEQEGKL
jgi:hypothetical protein